MSELAETIQESVERGKGSNINSRVAIFVALTATFMALCNIKDGNIVQNMQLAQANGVSAWDHYQAKSTKEALATNTIELMQTIKVKVSDSDMKVLKQRVQHYESDKEAIKKEAEGYQKEYDHLNMFDDQFDMTEALLSISISLFGITALTQKRWLLYFGATLALIGLILGICAFLGINLHSDFISKILG